MLRLLLFFSPIFTNLLWTFDIFNSLTAYNVLEVWLKLNVVIKTMLLVDVINQANDIGYYELTPLQTHTE